MSKTLQLAFWAGVIRPIAWFLSWAIPIGLGLNFALQPVPGGTTEFPLWLIPIALCLQLLVVATAVTFYFGFFSLGKHTKSKLLRGGALALLSISIIQFLFLLGSASIIPENIAPAIQVAFLILTGIAGVFFGVGLLSLKKELGGLGIATGVLTIIAYGGFATLIFFVLSVFTILPAIILQLMALKKMSTKLH